MSPERIDIIIPTYNGARTLDGTLASLAAQVTPADRVHVVLNGCVDDSEAVARRGLERIRAAGSDGDVVISLETGRCAALTTGDARAEGHRLYLDQDVRLGAGGLELVRAAFRHGAVFVCGEAIWRTPSWPVLQAMRAWNRLPYVRAAGVTAGMFGVSSTGRTRWLGWPTALPDDKWARLHFSPAERRRIAGLYYAVEAPDSFAGLIAARRRYRSYNVALSSGAPEMLADDVPRRRGLTAFSLNPLNMPGSGLLALAEILARRG